MSENILGRYSCYPYFLLISCRSVQPYCASRRFQPGDRVWIFASWGAQAGELASEVAFLGTALEAFGSPRGLTPLIG